MYKTMKKQYIKPENTIVALNVKVSLMEPSIPKGESVNGDYAGAREVLIQDNIQAPNAWEVWE